MKFTSLALVLPLVLAADPAPKQFYEITGVESDFYVADNEDNDAQMFVYAEFPTEGKLYLIWKDTIEDADVTSFLAEDEESLDQYTNSSGNLQMDDEDNGQTIAENDYREV